MSFLRSRLHRTPRWVGRLLAALAMIWLAWLLLGNLFLNTPLGPRIANHQPEKFRIDWRGGITLWPGRVTAWGVDMQGHVGNTLWSVRADRARGRIALWPLLAREVRVPHVHAQGVSGSVGRAGSERPRPEPRPGGWTLRFDRISSDSVLGGRLFEDWAIEGSGHAEVGFRKQLRGGPMELFASSAGFPAAALIHRGEPFARQARIGATFAMDEHVSAALPGLARLEVITATLDLDATAMLLQAALDEGGSYRFAMQPGSGHLQARLALERGVLAPGGQLHLAAPLVAVDATGTSRRNTLDLRVDVDRDIHLRVDVPDTGGEDAEPLMLDADLRMVGNRLPLADWRERVAGTSGRLRTDWHFSSLAWLARLFAPEGLLELEGHGAIRADLAIEDGRLQAGSRVEAPTVAASVAVAGQRFSGQARAMGLIEAGAEGPRSRLELVMDRFDIAPDEDGAVAYVNGRDLQLQVEADGELARVQDSAVASLRFNDAVVPDLRAYNRYLPAGELRFLGGQGRTSGELRIDSKGHAGDGRLRVDGRGARIAFAGLDVRGDVAIDARLQRADLKDREFALGGSTLRLRNAAFTGSDGRARSGWWAEVAVADGRMGFQADDRPRIEGNVRAQLKDVDFLLALFATRADYPRWIGRLVDSGRAEATGRVQWQDGTFVLDRGHAHNERFHVDARLRMRGARRSGDLYARWGRLGVGLELDGDERSLHLRNAREWYQSRPHLLR
ncbi:hypothetical protein [Luteimonas sp. A478]